MDKRHHSQPTFIEFPDIEVESPDDDDALLFDVSAKKILQSLIVQLDEEDHELFLKAIIEAATRALREKQIINS